ncbi:MAG: zinc ABC transporter substrate-binding protein [Candidatus Latescibacteria bacterium]|nr:zinc ABC transporter substrate-binding protein [Candidatus Latescibacterota bacterium]
MKNYTNRILRISSSFGILFLLIPVCCIWSQSKLQITVSIPPQKYFVEKIGGNLINVTVMVPSGSEPHSYEPKPQQLADLAQSSVYFAIGVHFERAWLERFKAANPNLNIVYTDKGIEKIPMQTEKRTQDSESHDDHTNIESMDPHIWLSPPLVIKQAELIYNALAKIDLINKEIYRKNYGNFVREVSELDTELKKVLMTKDTKVKFMVYHPAWGYFAKAYGLEQIPVEIEGKEPKPADLARMIDKAKESGIKTIFVHPQYSTKSAKTLADALKGEILFVDPLAYDWDKNLRNIAQQFKKAIK